MENRGREKPKLTAKRAAYEAKLSNFYDKKVIELKDRKHGKQ